MSNYRGPQRIRRAVGGRASDPGESKTQRCVCTVIDTDPECRDFCLSRSVWYFSVKITSTGSVLTNQPSRQNKTSALVCVFCNRIRSHLYKSEATYHTDSFTILVIMNLHYMFMTWLSYQDLEELSSGRQVSDRWSILGSKSQTPGCFFPGDHSVSTLLLKRPRESFQLCFWRQKADLFFFFFFLREGETTPAVPLAAKPNIFNKVSRVCGD